MKKTQTTNPKREACVTCGKALRRATSRHKCPHGVWCGIAGRPQLSYRSRTCERCNAEIAAGTATLLYCAPDLRAPGRSGRNLGMRT